MYMCFIWSMIFTVLIRNFIVFFPVLYFYVLKAVIKCPLDHERPIGINVLCMCNANAFDANE
jgi:hypothetical protein